jgi:hypothetical protein
MEVAPATTTSAAPAPAPAASSAEFTAPAAASTPPQVTVNSSGTPGTSTPKGGNTDGKWYDSFDPDTKEYVTAKGFQDPKSVVESYRNLEKLRGVPESRLLKLPEQSSADYDKSMGEVFEKLGKPATPEGYGLNPKDPNNSGFTNWAKDTFHKLNLTATQGQELVKQFNAYNEHLETEAKAAHTTQVQAQVGVLRKEWGAAFDQNVARAQAAYRQFGIPDKAIDSLEREIGFDGVMRMFHKLGTQVGEHEFITGNTTSSLGDGISLTPEQANARINALKRDADWSARYLKGDVKARQEMERLMKFANPTD